MVILRGQGPPGSDLRIWELPGGEPRLTIPLPGRQVVHLGQSVAFSPDGARVAALTKPAGPEPPRCRGRGPRLGRPLGRGAVAVRDRAGVGRPGVQPGRQVAGGDRRRWGLAPTAGGRLGEGGPRAHVGADRRGDPGDRLQPRRLAAGRAVRTIARCGSGTSRTSRRAAAAPPTASWTGRSRCWTRVAWGTDGRQVFAASGGGTLLSWPVAPREPQGRGEGIGPDRPDRGDRGRRRLAVRRRVRGPRPGDRAEGLGRVRQGPLHGRRHPRGSYDPPLQPQDGRAQPRRDPPGLPRLGSGRWDGTKPLGRLRVWDVATGREVFHRDDAWAFLHRAAFSPDGRRLALGFSVWNNSPAGRERWVHWVSIWDLETGRERLHLDVPLPTDPGVQPRRRPARRRDVLQLGEPGGGQRAPGLGRRDGRRPS